MTRETIVPQTIGTANCIHQQGHLLAKEPPAIHVDIPAVRDNSLRMSRKNIIMRRILSYFFYCLSGFFIYGICLMSFIYIPDIGLTKFYILGVTLLPAIVCIYLGATVDKFRQWKVSMGIVLLSGVTVSLLVVIAIICLQLSSKAEEFFPNHNLSMFTDYLAGILTMIMFASLGSFLFLSREKEKSRRCY